MCDIFLICGIILNIVIAFWLCLYMYIQDKRYYKLLGRIINLEHYKWDNDIEIRELKKKLKTLINVDKLRSEALKMVENTAKRKGG